MKNVLQPRLTELQERAMWAMLRLGTVQAHMPVDDNDPPWVVMSTIRALRAKGLVHLEERGRLRVIAPGNREMASPLLWDASLTRAGQEWVGARVVEIEGLASPSETATV